MKKTMFTRDYDMFESNQLTRDVTKHKKLEASMKKYGFDSASPLVVRQISTRKYKVVQGHHRLEIAKRLNTGVWFTLEDHQIPLWEIEQTRKVWTLPHFLQTHYKSSNPNYIKVAEYIKETGVSPSLAISMLSGQSAGSASGGVSDSFKSGDFKINTESVHAGIVKDIILFMRERGYTFFNHRPFVMAISKCIWVKRFSIKRFKDKLTKFAGLYHSSKCGNIDQYLELIEQIYNQKAPMTKKLNVAFEAKIEAGNRSAVRKKITDEDI